MDGGHIQVELTEIGTNQEVKKLKSFQWSKAMMIV